MATCDWCGKEVGKKTNEMTYYGEHFKICDSCMKCSVEKICRKCGNHVLNGIMFNGLCTDCATDEAVIDEVDTKDIDELIDSLSYGDAGFTNSDYESWLMTSYIGDRVLTPEHRKRVRINWLKARLSKIPVWTEENIIKLYPEIEEILDKNIPNKIKEYNTTSINKVKSSFSYLYSGKSILLPTRCVVGGKKYKLANFNKYGDGDGVITTKNLVLIDAKKFGPGNDQVHLVQVK